MLNNYPLDLGSRLHLVVGDYRPGGVVRTRIKARENLETMDISSLLVEEERVVEFIRKNRHRNVEFPDKKDSRISYLMDSGQYLTLIHQRMEKILLVA